MMPVDQKMTLDEIKHDQKKFLLEYGIETQFNESDLDWDCLMRIATHFDEVRPDYEEIALGYVKAISNFDLIHSVKYRVKKVDSLLKKIITKSSDGLEDIEPINEENYMRLITDLIGVRVLYVFKRDYLAIHKQLMKAYDAQRTEDVHIKLKAGDDRKIYSGIKKPKPVFDENSVYRSIHYTLRATEKTDSPRVEIQTRTVFEEAWSEINHKLVYKNEDSSEYLFLMQASRILSSLTGDCDSLGDLMKGIHDDHLERLAKTREQEVAKGVVFNQKELNATSEQIMKEVMSDFLHKKN